MGCGQDQLNPRNTSERKVRVGFITSYHVRIVIDQLIVHRINETTDVIRVVPSRIPQDRFLEQLGGQKLLVVEAKNRRDIQQDIRSRRIGNIQAGKIAG